MKKNHPIKKIFILMIIGFSLLVNIVYASFGYTAASPGSTGSGVSGFTTLILCEENLAKAKVDLPTWKFTNCTTATDAPLVIPQRTNDKPIDIGLKKIDITATNDTKYTLLAPLPGIKGGCIDTDTTNTECASGGIGGYIGLLFKIGIGLAAALAVVMLIINGITYMGDESVFGKTEAKSKMFGAVLGLIIAIGSYALLNTINPDLIGTKLNIAGRNIEIVGDVNAPTVTNSTDLTKIGIICDKTKTNNYSAVTSVANSFNNKMTYSQKIPKGQIGTDNTVRTDCSGFVNAVLQCSGVDTSKMGINSGTSVIFAVPKAEKVVDKTKTTATSINGKPLAIGDLVGWKPTDDKDRNGHVMIYIGKGLVADSHGPSKGNIAGKAFGSFSLMKYQDRITYVVRTWNLP